MSPSPAVAAVPRGHPRGLYLLFFVEAFERVSYYGMRAFLVLYLVDASHGLGWTRAQALSLYGTYTGLVYLTPILGGYLADRYLGQRLAVVIGGTLMMFGQFLCAVKSVPVLYMGIVVLILGNGFFKANISTMVGQLYAPGDRRRDGAFTIFYMGINLGGFLGPLVCGSLAEGVDWSLGFSSAGLGMAFGVLTFLALKGKLLGEVGKLGYEQRREASGAVAKGPLTKAEKDRVVVIFVIALFVVFFWAAFEQAGGLMNLYTDQRVDRHILGWEMPTTWVQSFNAGFIILFAPLFAWLWGWLGARGKEPSTPVKMAFGLLLVSAGFALMVGAANQSAGGGRASLAWVIGAYLFNTWGELSLSPVGLSMVTKLAPKRFASAMMGVWFLSNASANKIAGVLGGYADKLGELKLFGLIVIGSAAAGILLLLISRMLVRMMHGAEHGVPPAIADIEPARVS